jgi:signal transduction histidine kinase
MSEQQGMQPKAAAGSDSSFGKSWGSAKPTKLRVAGGFLFGFSMLFSAISVAYFVKRRIFESLGLPPLFFDLLVQAAIAFLIMVIIFGTLRFTIGERQRRDLTRPFLDAMDRIARGDYSVRLADDLPGMHPMAELIRRFNTMVGDLDKVEQLRRDFVSNVSHEIQSPLTSIRGFAQALRKEDLPKEDRSHYLDVIEEESMRLSKLGDNLVRLAALESEQLKLSPREFKLDAQLRQVILAAEPQWTAKKLEMDVDLGECSVTADPELLGQVWTNLLHNGVKFTPAGGALCVALARVGAAVEVSFTDNGIGIGEDDQARIFERFYKADKSRRWSEEGSGLGLSIVKRIVDLHGGTIQVSSQLGQGTRVTVRLGSA